MVGSVAVSSSAPTKPSTAFWTGVGNTPAYAIPLKIVTSANTGARPFVRIGLSIRPFMSVLLRFGSHDTCGAGASALLAGLTTGSPLSAMSREASVMAATCRSSGPSGAAGYAARRSWTNTSSSSGRSRACA